VRGGRESGRDSRHARSENGCGGHHPTGQCAKASYRTSRPCDEDVHILMIHLILVQCRLSTFDTGK
jgi:hypothetical protein